VGVAVLIFRAGKLLLIQRKGAHGAGSWATPGGHLEYGEDPSACARREAKEEVGVDLGEVAFHAVTNDLFVEEGKHYITLWMSGRISGGEPCVAAEDEVAEWGWFDPTDLPQPLFLPLRNLLSGHSLFMTSEGSQDGV
jgi:8-oxo-dGTP diphosphatase